MNVDNRNPAKRRVTLEITEKIDKLVLSAMQISGLSLSDIIRQCIVYALPILYPETRNESKKDLDNDNER